MNQQSVANTTLFDLLARSWQRPAAIRQLRFNDDETALALVTADGAVAYARMADNEPPEARIVSDGGQNATLTGIRPRSGRPSPLIMTRIKGVDHVCLAADGGFLATNDRNQLVRLSRAGETSDTLFSGENPIAAFDRCPATGDLAVVAGGRLLVKAGQTDLDRALEGFAPSLIAFSPDGAMLALSGEGRIEIRRHDGREVVHRIANQAAPMLLTWSDDSRWLAIGMHKGGLILVEAKSGRHARLDAFPGPVAGLGFGNGGHALVAAGAYRIAGWSLKTPPLDHASTGALATGRSGLAMVEAVAAQTHGDLVAAGYANGQIVIARLGAPDEMVLRMAGGPVTALAWTSDGRHLAVGDAGGLVAIVTFPPQLFK